MADEHKPSLAPSLASDQTSDTSELTEQLSQTQLEEPLVDNGERKPDPHLVEWFRENSIPIAGVIFILLVFCLVSHFRSATGWTKAKDITDVLLNIVQIVAFLAGGWWAYFKFVKGRAFKESLIPAVSGKLRVIDNKTYLVANIRVKNVGQSVIEFAPNASSLKLFGYASFSSTEIVTASDEKLTQFEALDENDRYIEPNEIIDETRFIFLPNAVQLGIRLELEIISLRKYTWRTSAIVEKSTPNAIIAESITAGE